MSVTYFHICPIQHRELCYFKFPEFLFVDTATCADFLLEKSGTEFSYLLSFFGLIWQFYLAISDLSCLLVLVFFFFNFSFCWSTVWFYYQIFVLTFNPMLWKTVFHIEFSLSDHFWKLVSTPLMSLQQSLREIFVHVLVCIYGTCPNHLGGRNSKFYYTLPWV